MKGKAGRFGLCRSISRQNKQMTRRTPRLERGFLLYLHSHSILQLAAFADQRMLSIDLLFLLITWLMERYQSPVFDFG